MCIMKPIHILLVCLLILIVGVCIYNRYVASGFQLDDKIA